MVINTGKEPEEAMVERVNEGIVQETDMVINKSGNLKDHILELNREISAIRAKHQVGKEEFRVILKLYETWLIPALLYGLEALGKIGKAEMNQIEKIQGITLEKIFSLPISTSYIDLRIQAGAWPAYQRIQYSTMMLYYNIMNSDHKRVARKY